MRRRALIGTITTLGAVAVVGLFAALSFLLSSPSSAFAQGINSAPEFATETATRSVDENTAAFTNIVDPITATDSDTDDKLTYSIENTRTKNFTIHQRTGQLQVGGPLDYETENSYTVTVKATDPSGDSDTIEVTIDVNNLDEDGKVSLSWTKPQVGTEITATLTDPDGITPDPTWQWEKSSNRRNWSNATGTGATSATYTPVANDGYLRATASYTDGEGPTKTALARTATTVRTVPTTNNPPVFRDGQEGQYDCEDDNLTTFCMYAKTSFPVGESIYYPVKATDADRGDEIRYSLEGTHAGHFYIEPTRGELFTKTLPRDLPAESRFDIKAEDQSGASDTISVKITKSGLGRDPVIVGPSRITYPENGTWPVARYSASNANDGTIGWIVSVQPGGGDGDFFRINDEGMLLFEQPPDYEEPLDYPNQGAVKGNNIYSFSITAYETNPPSGSWPQQSYFPVTVTVVNVDESLEILGPSVIDYPENRTDAVHTFTVSESDGPVTWSPPSGTDGDHFSISETGILTFINPPDYENPLDLDGGGRDKDQPDNGYLVAITVEDGTNIKTEHVKVRVTNVNERPEFDDDLETTISVDSDIGSSQQVGDPYTASDPDEAASLTYSLSTDTLPFEIDPYNGQLSTKSTLTQFARTSYTVTVLVTDNADAEGDVDTTADDQITITINVGEASNNAPVFSAVGALTFTLDENTETVEEVDSPVTATDGDNDTVSYTLEGTDAGFFTIVRTSGQIKTKANQKYDYETKPTYSVTVKAADNNGGAATKAVTINLNNLEEEGTVTFAPAQPSARNPITASVTDLDGVVTGTTIWQWAKSSNGNTGWSNVGTNSDTYTPVDGDATYYLRATASYTDGEASGKTAQAQTTQAVGAGSNRPPTFTDGQTTSRDVAENTAASGNVGAVVAATDADSDSLTYSLTSTDASSFTVDNTGQIKVGSATTLDHESAKNTYTVVVQVTDSKDAAGNTEATPTIDDIITVTINVTNVDEDGTVTLSMTHPSARTPITATLSDPDSGVTAESWQWAKSTTAQGSYSDITGATSATYTPADEDVGEFLRATVSYEDDHGQNQTAEAVSDNAVQAGANRAPTFAGGTVTREVLENSAANVNVGSPVTATDQDTGNTLEYSLEGTDKDDFKIVSDSGQIQTKQDVNYDYENDTSYSVTVKADDQNGGTATKAVTINVTDVEEAGTVSFSTTHPVVRAQITATLTDPDGGVTGTTWVWTSSSTAQGSYTAISGATSATYTPVDGDLNKFLKATATYTDRRPGTGKTAAAVSDNAVGAGTNRAPTFASSAVTLTVPENSAANVNVGSPVTATDLDTGNTLTYTLEGADKDSFKVVSDGQIQTKSGVTYDFETKDTYLVTVKADDGNNGGTATKDVTITLTNVEEAGTVRLSPTQPAARQAVTATLTDPDEVSGTPTWQWQRSSDGNSGWTNVGTNSSSYTPPDADLTYYLQGQGNRVLIGCLRVG